MSNFSVLYDACVLYPTPLRDLAPNIVCAAAKRHKASLKNPPRDVEEYLATLEAQGLAQKVSSLRRFAELI